MKVTYALERMQDVRREMEELVGPHWQEVGQKDMGPVDPDWEAYFAMENAGGVHMVVARAGGRMVGYAVHFVRRHLHYRTRLCAIADVYFLLPEFRCGRIGLELFKQAERTLKARGVHKIYTGTKVYADKSRVFEHLDYELTEKLFTKVIQHND